MVGGNDFRLGPPYRASDPSLEEMLRRARDVPMGGDGGATDHHTPIPPTPPARVRGRVVPARGSFWVGVMVGALVMYLATHAGLFAGGATTPAQPVVQSVPDTATVAAPTPTDMPLPTPTATPVPTPTDAPIVTVAPSTWPPPSLEVIMSLAREFYDQQSPYAGSYLLMDVTGAQIDAQDADHITACIAYDYAAVGAPGTIIGTDIRLFTANRTGPGTWRMEMIGDTHSCQLG